MAWKALLPRTIWEAGITDNGAIKKIPYRTPSGSVFRYRHKMGDREWWGTGEGTLPYGLETLCYPLRASRSTLVICEGESDTLALREVLRGLNDPGIYVIGCPGSQNWRFEWQIYTDAFNVVIVLGDGDQAGLQFVERTRGMIPGAFGWTMPEGDDVRSMIQEVGADSVIDGIRECEELVELFKGEFPG